MDLGLGGLGIFGCMQAQQAQACFGLESLAQLVLVQQRQFSSLQKPGFRASGLGFLILVFGCGVFRGVGGGCRNSKLPCKLQA